MVLFGRQKLPTTRKFIQLNAVVVFAQTRLKACQRLLSIERRCVHSLRELLHGKRRIRQKKQRFKCAFSLRARSHDANTFLPYLRNVVCIIDYAGVRVPLALIITRKKRTACHVPPPRPAMRLLRAGFGATKTKNRHETYRACYTRVAVMHTLLTNYPASKTQLRNAEPVCIVGMHCLTIFAFLGIRSAVTPAH